MRQPRRTFRYDDNTTPAEARLVAILPFDTEDPGEVWNQEIWFAPVDEGFFLTDTSRPPGSKPTRHTTFRKALSLAVKNGGWG